MIKNTEETKKGVERSSIEKVWNLILEKRQPLSSSAIASEVGLQVSSVRSCVELLERFDKISVIRVNRIWIIQLKEGVKGSDNGIPNSTN